MEIRDWRTLNRTFYDTFAAEFSRSREALNPGIGRALLGVDLSWVLDVGCGDGRVSKAVTGHYVGLDFSANLIGRNARASTSFALADLASPLPISASSFPTVLCLATLHHLPDRLALMHELTRVLKPDGHLVVSVWQITHNERMRKKIVEDLGNGDYVLNWKSGGEGLRWVHEVSENELRELGSAAGLDVIEMYRSDGKSGDLGLYGIFTLTPDPSPF